MGSTDGQSQFACNKPSQRCSKFAGKSTGTVDLSHFGADRPDHLVAQSPQSDADGHNSEKQYVERRLLPLGRVLCIVGGHEGGQRGDRVAHVVGTVREAGKTGGEYLEGVEKLEGPGGVDSGPGGHQPRPEAFDPATTGAQLPDTDLGGRVERGRRRTLGAGRRGRRGHWLLLGHLIERLAQTGNHQEFDAEKGDGPHADTDQSSRPGGQGLQAEN